MSNETTTAENEGTSALAQAVQAAQEAKEEKVEFTIVQTETLPRSVLKLQVEVDRAEWDRRTEKFFQDIRPQMQIEGFRKGKVPVALLRSRYSEAATADIAERVTPLIIRDIARDKNLTVYGQPAITDISKNPGQPVSMTIEIEVKPEIAVSNYTGRSVEAPKFEPSEAMIESRLQALREQNATFVEEPKAHEPGDAVVLDLQVTDEKGFTVSTETDRLYENPASQLPVQLVSELVGKSAGAEGYTMDADGKTYRWTLRSVRARKLPELDDEFAKDLGKESLEEVRAGIRAEIETSLNERNMDGAFDKLVETLVGEHQFEVPPTLMQNVVKELANQDYMMLRYTGRVPTRLAEGYDEEGNRSKKAYEAALSRDGEQRVRGYLLLDAIGEKEGIVPAEEDINKALEQRAAQENRKPIAIRAALERQRRWNDFVENVRFDKIRDFLMASTTINWTKPAEPSSGESGDAGENA